MVGYDHYGDDITQMSGATLQALAAACNASPTCYAFNWSPYSYMASGYLKTTGTSVSGMAGMCFYKWTSEQGLLGYSDEQGDDLLWSSGALVLWSGPGAGASYLLCRRKKQMQDLGVQSVPGQFVSTWAD